MHHLNILFLLLIKPRVNLNHNLAKDLYQEMQQLEKIDEKKMKIFIKRC